MNNFIITTDTTSDLPAAYVEQHQLGMLSLTYTINDTTYSWEHPLPVKEFYDCMRQGSLPTTSQANPEEAAAVFEKIINEQNADILHIAFSSGLSGSYNSAELGKKLYLEKYGHKNIFICDSESASCGETNQALLAAKLCEEGLPFEEVCRRVAEYRDHMHTYFVLDNLETLRKNGRLTGVKALVASTLSIKPVMGAEKGAIIQLGQAIGIKKGLAKMAAAVAADAVHPEEKTLMITHCNCLERAEAVKNMVLQKISCRDVVIMDTRGVSSMYANDGGVIVTL